jgi:hypothetical protein
LEIQIHQLHQGLVLHQAFVISFNNELLVL